MSGSISEMTLVGQCGKELDHEETFSLGRELALYPINQGIMMEGCRWLQGVYLTCF